MTVWQIGKVIAAVLFFGFVYYRLVRWMISEWRKVEAEEEELRR